MVELAFRELDGGSNKNTSVDGKSTNALISALTGNFSCECHQRLPAICLEQIDETLLLPGASS